MAKRKEEEPKKGSPAWMSTFSDLMNLLLCFFILLFASSTVDAEKLQQIAASFSKDNIFNAGSTAVGDGRMVSTGVKQLSFLDNFVASLGRNEKGSSSNLSDVKEETDKMVDANVTTAAQLQDEKIQAEATTQSEQQNESSSNTVSDEELQKKVEETGYEQSEQMNSEIEKMLKSAKISDKVSLSYTAQYVEMSMNGGILFESGSADLTKDAKKLVDKVGSILEKYKKRTIEIEGHTDNIPIGGEFKDNQYLSAARAITVYEYLLENHDLIASNMKHSGYGDNQPKASNKTEAGRAKNRRVEIKIYNKISSETN